jgi:hypothetical protein
MVFLFSISNEHILVSLLIPVVFRSVIRWSCVYCIYTADLGSYIIFLVVFCWIVVDYCEFVILYEVSYFMFAYLLCKYNYFFLCLLLL